MKARHTQTLAGIVLALGSTVAAPFASAQTNRVPDPNATRVMVAVFRAQASDRKLGVDAADAVRSRINNEFPFKQVYALPKQDITATLEASGFSTTEALAAHDAKALANLLRADEYITGNVSKTPTGVKVDAFLVLARDNTLIQPLGSAEAGNVGGASAIIAKELKEARKQLDGEKKCVNAARAQQWDAAAAAAREGITAYPKAVLARICLASVMIEQKAPAAERMKLAQEIVSLHPTSNRGLRFLADAYSESKMQDSVVTTMTRLLATDPTNPRLQKEVVDIIVAYSNPAIARPIIDTAVATNPGDPDLLKLRWLILLAQKDWKSAFTQGDELIRLDTAFADTTYFIKTARAFEADSQFAKAAETAAKGLQKFANHPELVYTQISALRSAGQNQQALEALEKALAAKVPVENGQVFRVLLLKDLGRTAEMLPAIRSAIAAGDTSTNLRALVVQQAGEARVAAQRSKKLEDFEAAHALIAYADTVAKPDQKVQAQFLMGANYVLWAQAKLEAGAAQKNCQLLKDAKNYIVEAQILLPRGGSFAPDAMRTLMGAVMQLDPIADSQIKANCK